MPNSAFALVTLIFQRVWYHDISAVWLATLAIGEGGGQLFVGSYVRYAPYPVLTHLVLSIDTLFFIIYREADAMKALRAMLRCCKAVAPLAPTSGPVEVSEDDESADGRQVAVKSVFSSSIMVLVCEYLE